MSSFAEAFFNPLCYLTFSDTEFINVLVEMDIVSKTGGPMPNYGDNEYHVDLKNINWMTYWSVQ